jgi:hypothetical protein
MSLRVMLASATSIILLLGFTVWQRILNNRWLIDNWQITSPYRHPR